LRNQWPVSKPDWRVTDSSYAIDTQYLRLRKDRIELADGTVIDDYYVRESRGFVIVFALTADGRVVLVHQYKHGISQTLLELPAGAIDPGETPEACAARELAEETGYRGSPPELVRSFIIEPTNSNSIGHLFVIRDAEERQAQQLDVTEKIDVRLVTLPELREMVRDGTIDSVSHVASIYLVLDRLREL